ncbi:MAG TPA: secondary thiamine-phosphate synthase enzyme YjbQ [Methanobacteriaceae archaeon]|nr:secondary thiamine-phosphate synthase enzyme YjbQ [Methanobacteriaceae archaeon]HNS25193.1 secondary thiamine-phosphate synthase enzyme YjbQ [Methanobacteriaceae archaeon]
MQMFRQMVDVHTSKRLEMVDITRLVEEAVESSNLKEGLVNIYSRHSTSAVVINENESGLKEDFLVALDKLVPTGAGYLHDRIDHNADSHIRGFLVGGSQTVPFQEGRLMLGTWQSIFFVELDGPRHRTLTVTVTGQ